jgi:hypothetical protein
MPERMKLQESDHRSVKLTNRLARSLFLESHGAFRARAIF